MEKSKIYTKTGDDGTTALVGGNRVKKSDLRIEAYGTVDELNASIGLLRSLDVDNETAGLLKEIQNKLFNIGSLLAADEKGKNFTAGLAITETHIKVLEDFIDKFDSRLPKLKGFVIPGGDATAAQCHVSRTVCRRTERQILRFSEQKTVQPEILKYINRLSDLLFILARKISSDRNTDETYWSKD